VLASLTDSLSTRTYLSCFNGHLDQGAILPLPSYAGSGYQPLFPNFSSL
jgi:hypothetical protein